MSHDFVDHYRGSEHTYDYMWEERWVRYEGYSKIIPEAVNGLLKKPGMTMDGVTKLCFPCFFKAEQMAIAKALGAAGKVADNMHEVCGETGVAHPFVMLVKALEEASPGDMILLAGFGQGCDALLFKVTDEIKKLPARRDRRCSATASRCQPREVLQVPRAHRLRDGDPRRGERRTAMSTLGGSAGWSWPRRRQAQCGRRSGRARLCGTRRATRTGS